ncbi:entericidin B precursor [Salmonella enterica subsp. enterica serovar Muenster]|uniref:Entericidin B n=1 Tax=Salmonella muenster TaxID=82689 RepID=A0A5X0WX52_SALMS|nr:entericidin B precursor [Salmonella enterica subsp. enterica serovar Muenster str. 0315]AUM51709.1 entericidin B precursor [Salmonella enterica subsp. enterica serovar Muenster str. 420]EAA1033630.1 entericidin B precursor [Salmonella enterica subsp. enterica serovar Senftenberg]EAA3001303.1 entericidin B precursor [Salmonella enterica subsp. enterica serovar Muenster]EAA7319582.1 entericidin B precursor [Salmonella enterica subsp. enterica]EAA8690251.1 entericidin B precursor [Salmonella e
MKFFKKVIRVRKSEKRGSFVQVANSKVVFYIHLQLIKDNILSMVICYT